MDAAANQRMVRLERQVDFLFRHLGLDPGKPAGQDVPLPSSFYAALSNGRMAEAVKIYREVTGTGLAQAKSEVDAMARQAGS